MSGTLKWGAAWKKTRVSKRGAPSIDKGAALVNRDERNRELVAAARAGDARSLDLLVRENESLLVAIASRSIRGARTRAWREELLQEMRMVLVEAARTFDPTRGVRFSSWVGQLTRPVAQRLFASVALRVEVPHDVYGAAFLGHKQERPVPEEHVAAARGCLATLTIVEETRGELNYSYVPGTIPIDLLPSRMPEQDRAVERSERIAHAEIALSCLTPRELDFVARNLVGDETLQSIADSLSPPLSRERVRQVVAASLPKMQRALLAAGYEAER